MGVFLATSGTVGILTLQISGTVIDSVAWGNAEMSALHLTFGIYTDGNVFVFSHES